MFQITDKDERDDKVNIEAKVVVGEGNGDFFKEYDLNFTTPYYKIYSINTFVEVSKCELTNNNKLLFDAWIYKDVVYKTILENEICNSSTTISGELRHISKNIPISGCIEIIPTQLEFIDLEIDSAELIEACVLGELDENLDGKLLSNFNPPIFIYNKLHEKICINFKFEVIRWKSLKINNIVL